MIPAIKDSAVGCFAEPQSDGKASGFFLPRSAENRRQITLPAASSVRLSYFMLFS